MIRAITALVAAAALVTVPGDLDAQRVATDLRTVVATETQRLAGADLSVGIGFGATIAYQLQPHLAAYGGWDWIHFQAEQSFAGVDMDFEETGYTAGLRFEHPVGSSDLMFRIEGGATYKHVEIEDVAGAGIADSGHDFGFEAGGGIVFPLGETWRLTPTMRFRSLSPAFAITGVTTKTDFRYAGVELGVSRHF
jgi:hypothetical protein